MIGEFWTRITIWAALTLYGGSVICYFEKQYSLARFFWTVGCIFYLTHVAFAFHFFHDWSHEIAVRETATQTKTVTGFATGVGIYVNYLFTAVWLIDTLYWLLVGNERYANRSSRVFWWLHGFFLFMILNGAVIFTQGKSRWIGTALLSVIVINFMIAGLKKMFARSLSDTNSET